MIDTRDFVSDIDEFVTVDSLDFTILALEMRRLIILIFNGQDVNTIFV